MRHRSTLRRLGRMMVLCLILLWCVFPFAWLVDTSLKLGNNALNSPLLWQGPFGFANYVAAFGQGFGHNMRNSAVVAGISTILCVFISSPAAYALGRLRLRRKVWILSGLLAASLFPPIALVAPLYEVWLKLGLLDTYPGLYIPYTAFSLPLTIFILTTSFTSIPWEMEEAARVDGATPFQAFSRVILPLAAPGIFTASILVFVSSWNEFLIASTVAPRNPAVQTIPVAISTFTGSVPFERPIGTITAACVTATVPLILLVLLFQKRIIAGLTAGAIKG